MKKGLKALILGGLASLVLFAVIYASPIAAQAAPRTYNIVLYAEATGDECGNGIISYDDSELYFYGDEECCVGYWMDTTDVAMQICAFARRDVDASNSVPFSYSFTFAGSNYSGTVYLTYVGDDDYYFLGLISQEDSSATGYYKQINDLKDLISRISNDSTLTGDARVIEFNVGTALPKDVIATLANSTGVTVKFTFVYKGFEFCTTITSEDAKRIYDPEIEWYGPCFLAENCPTVWTGKTAA